MDKKELNHVSDSVTQKDAVIPSAQPVPKKENEIRAAENVNIKGNGRAK